MIGRRFCNENGSRVKQQQEQGITLEEMLMKLEMEEGNGDDEKPGKIAMCARDAYPRFSLDGKDAMYRSSFLASEQGRRRSVCCDHRLINSSANQEKKKKMKKKASSRRPTTVGGERVVWCKPGVVAKLMGLDAIPLPLLAITHSHAPFFM